MKLSWGVGVALCGGLAVLFLVHPWGSQPTDTQPRGDGARAGVDHAAVDARGGSGFSGLHASGGGANAEGGSGGPTGPAERARAGYADADAPRRLPPAAAATGAAGRKLARIGDAAAGEPTGGGDGRDRSLDVAPGRRDLPSGAYGAQRGAGGANANLPGAVPEVAYDGGAEHIFDMSSKVEVSDAGAITGDAGTVAFWLQPQWEANNQDDASIIQLGDSGMQIVKSGDSLRFEYSDNNGNENGGGADIHDWPAGEWRQVTATWNGSTLALYIDGGQVFVNTSTTPPNFQGETKLYVGSVTPDGSQPVTGNVTSLTVTNSFTPSENVGQLLKGGPPHR